MSTPRLPPELLQEALDALAQHGSTNKAAKALGISRSTLQNRLDKANQHPSSAKVEMPSFVLEGDDEEPIEDIIERMARNFERAKRNAEAKKWFPVKVQESLPFGIMFVGDPHVDDNGCNWPVLKEHMRICRETEGIYAVNVGDASNSWGGRLIRKYAEQDTSVATARRLVEWLLLESGARWLVWLMGNHEHMGDAAPLLHEMNKRHGTQRVPMIDWDARFVLEFPEGIEFRINVAHDFPGNSMWNPLHGPLKAAKFGDNIDVIVCGHKHNWAVAQWENPDQGTIPLIIRTRGYKHHDDYARKIGKYEQEEGQSILVVFDPLAQAQTSRAVAFPDIERGAEYLKWLRQKAK